MIHSRVWRRRPASITSPASLDLGPRVIAAIDFGPSCRAAAALFGVAASGALKRHRRSRDFGSVAPQAQGGDTRSGRIEALAPAILAMAEKTPAARCSIGARAPA